MMFEILNRLPRGGVEICQVSEGLGRSNKVLRATLSPSCSPVEQAKGVKVLTIGSQRIKVKWSPLDPDVLVRA